MKLLLAYPEIECSVTNTSTYSLPLSLGSIATYCNSAFNTLETKILDGSFVSHKEQLAELERFQPDATAISPTIASQRNGYDLGEKAKQLGSLVFFGGVNSTNLWHNMMRNREFIDGVVLYDGEIPMSYILSRLNMSDGFDGISNLVYRDGKYIHRPLKINVPQPEQLPDIDYSLFDLEGFFEQTQKRGFGKAVTYYAGKGCIKRGKTALRLSYYYEEFEHLVRSMNTCTFCGRNEPGLRNFDEEREARIIRELHENYGVTGFFNVQDSVNLDYTTPMGLEDCWFRLFIGLEQVTPGNIQKLKQRYGPNLIFQVGVESISPEMRRRYNKKAMDENDLFSRVKLMKEEGIKLHASFILGGRGEVDGFVYETTAAIRKLSEYENVTWILVSPQLILPGSPDFKFLLESKGMMEKYANEDLIDIVEISQDFLNLYSDLTRGFIIEQIRNTFADIRRDSLVLDVKGVVAEEKEYINPDRDYSTST